MGFGRVHVRAFFLTLSILGVLAGCASPTESTPAATTNNTTTVAAMAPLAKSYPVSQPVAAPPQAPVEPSDTEKAMIDVPTGYTHLKATLKATCASPTCNFGMTLVKDGKDVKSGGDALDAPVTAGKYEIDVQSLGPGAGMSGTIDVTLT